MGTKRRRRWKWSRQEQKPTEARKSRSIACITADESTVDFIAARLDKHAARRDNMFFTYFGIITILQVLQLMMGIAERYKIEELLKEIFALAGKMAP